MAISGRLNSNFTGSINLHAPRLGSLGISANRPSPPQAEAGAKERFQHSHRYGIQIDSVEIAYFSECSPLIITTETKDYAEGGLNTYVHKLPVRTRYENITLKHGLDEGQDLFRWYLKTLNEPQPGSSAASGTYRRHLSIVMYDPLGQPLRRWDLRDAFPVKWTGPSLSATNTAAAVETVEIAHSGLVNSTTAYTARVPSSS